MKKGNLVKLLSGEYGTIVQGPYPFRFTNTQTDRDMIDSGMGHLAGTYGSAIDIISHKTGCRSRHNISSNSFEVIDEVA
tara:strand:+ start:410 stop:646 length:237 start_codon:yes stop_codon:yes gene_type:complete